MLQLKYDVMQKRISPCFDSSFLRQPADSFGMTISLFSCGESGGDLLKANRRRFPHYPSNHYVIPSGVRNLN